MNDAPIGRVVATENNPTTTDYVRFWIESDVRLKPYDFVKLTPSPSGTREIGEFYAIIDEIKQVSDETSPLTGYISADFGQPQIEPRMSRIITTYAEATVLFNTNDIEMPVPHGAEVHWPDKDGVRRALGIEDYGRKTPAGYITMSGPEGESMAIPVDMDADYLIGPQGAHLNISGISGLATKTSYAMFLLTAVQQTQNDWVESSRPSFVILNVKGTDLLRLHEKNPDLSDETKRDWEKCGLVAGPLHNVTYFYPYSSSEASGYAQTKLDSRIVRQNVEDEIAFRYYYDMDTARQRLLLLVEDMDDPNQTLVSCTEYCQEKIDPETPWHRFRENLKKWSASTPDSKILVGSWRRFARLIGQRTRNPIFTELTTECKEKRQVPLKRILEHLSPGRVVVIDIAQLPDYLQSFVVGDVIELIRHAKMGTLQNDDDSELDDEKVSMIQTVVLFADELNKFAPHHHAERSITRHLREVSERGRSEGIILFGAEQFRTGVNKQVTGNSSTQVFGRTTAVEASRDTEINSQTANKKRVPFLRKGELMVSHPRYSAGVLKIRFPRNAYFSDS